MFYDLNVPWPQGSGGDLGELRRTVAFLDECEQDFSIDKSFSSTKLSNKLKVGYNVIALTQSLSGKLVGNLVRARRSQNLRVETSYTPIVFYILDMLFSLNRNYIVETKGKIF
jgi:hypothetical protein